MIPPSGPQAARLSAGGALLLGLYAYLPLPAYLCLWIAWLVGPRGEGGLDWRLALRSLPPRGRRAIWFHAASVGEISTIAPVVTEVRRAVPGVPIVVTTMTRGGARRAAEKLDGAEIVLVPFDFLPVVRRFVRAIEPACLVIGETEIWPNMIREAKRQGAAVVLVNGRISNKSHPRYKLIKFFLRHVLGLFDLLLMRSETDARRIIELGAPADRVEVAGNTKYDMLPEPVAADRRKAIRRSLGLADLARVVALGSAREGESEMVIRALAACGNREGLHLVIAPRHLDLVPQIEQAAEALGWPALVLSDLRLPEGRPPAGVMILAQMGRLLEIYAISDVAIVGGTLRPFGGHNPLEPASQGVATVVGPYTHNIKDDMAYLTARQAALVVDEAGLGPAVARLLERDDVRLAMGQAAARAVLDRKGIAAGCVGEMARRGLLPRA